MQFSIQDLLRTDFNMCQLRIHLSEVIKITKKLFARSHDMFFCRMNNSLSSKDKGFEVPVSSEFWGMDENDCGIRAKSHV